MIQQNKLGKAHSRVAFFRPDDPGQFPASPMFFAGVGLDPIKSVLIIPLLSPVISAGD
ncbi:hypothetical protein [uncultured Sunxiuqinia sp.]|uniref:hypothetical protein n=1 Tax=uncultured Sunxiuqinia sp. TaxID=1573825 RepID=UPI0030DA6614